MSMIEVDPIRPGVLSRFTSRWTRDWFVVVGGGLIAVIVLAALLAPWITPYPQDAQGAVDPVNGLLPPSAQHWFGTDKVGRDIFTRVVFGARTSLLVVACVLIASIIIGVILGVWAGYAGGWWRDVIMRITDVFLAFPALLLALALALVLPRGLPTLIIAISVTWWPWYTRLIAAVANSVSERPYVEVARTLGEPGWRIVGRHVLPNSLTPVVVQASLDAGGIILVVATLSYLGLGVSEPTAEWGLMVQQGQSLLGTQWWVVTFPGLAIMVTALAFNLLGEGLRESLDPRRRTR